MYRVNVEFYALETDYCLFRICKFTKRQQFFQKEPSFYCSYRPFNQIAYQKILRNVAHVAVYLHSLILLNDRSRVKRESHSFIFSFFSILAHYLITAILCFSMEANVMKFNHIHRSFREALC